MALNIRDALQQEMALSTGCTEVGCIALLTAVAAKELGGVPDRIELSVSPNIMKNGINVCVPGTGGRGIPIAAAMGSVMQTPQAGLSILEHANKDHLLQAEKLVAEKRIHVDLQDTDELIYAQARLEKDGHTVTATLSGGHQRISEIKKDDSVCFFAEETVSTDAPEKFHFRGIAGSSLIEAALKEDPAQYEFLWDAAQTNLQAAQAGLEKNKVGIGQAMQKMEEELPMPYAAVHQAQLWTSAASEARMGGLPVPIMSIAGSGNHGIANFLGMLAVGKALNAPREEIIRAITLSSVLTVYAKEYTGRVTAYCGSALAPTAGVAAGTVFLLGGDTETMIAAIHTLLGTYAGILCDGAKESCAYKVSRGVSAAVEAAFLAMDHASVPPMNGIVGASLEETLENLGKVNDPGMVETERLVLNMIRERVN
ncbi:MAG: L-serine ammonia-lyase, iron-sulfur-dependent, subunit alpha [Anaerolineaceae bacterium]|jgi:L-cysteine desulfidase|nr:L-serine ammonia-lyase, iron-sulfur-dependent, subunit alpha [Anaerolineaceae bacterium]